MRRRTDENKSMDLEAVTRVAQRPVVAEVVVDKAVPLCLFHFAEYGDYISSPLIYAHRNGHGSMIYRTMGGQWRLSQRWADPVDVQARASDFVRNDIGDLFAIVGEGADEALTFLPKFCGERPRLVAYRENILALRWGARGSETFRLIDENGRESELFSGKLWECVPALDWCQMNLGSTRDTFARQEARQRNEASAAQRLAAGLPAPMRARDTALWGMF